MERSEVYFFLSWRNNCTVKKMEASAFVIYWDLMACLWFWDSFDIMGRLHGYNAVHTTSDHIMAYFLLVVYWSLLHRTLLAKTIEKGNLCKVFFEWLSVWLVRCISRGVCYNQESADKVCDFHKGKLMISTQWSFGVFPIFNLESWSDIHTHICKISSNPLLILIPNHIIID
jgi:hypothetical protein